MDVQTVLEGLIGEMEAPLAKADAALREAQDRVDQLKAERYGLELALARHRREPAPPQPSRQEPSPPENEWQRLDRSAAIEKVLAEAGSHLHRKVIQARLREHGRSDSLDHVSASLAYLKGVNRVVSLGDGDWVHPKFAPPSTNGSAPLADLQATSEVEP